MVPSPYNEDHIRLGSNDYLVVFWLAVWTFVFWLSKVSGGVQKSAQFRCLHLGKLQE